MAKVKISQDRKSKNVIFQTDNFKAVFTLEMFRKMQRGGGSVGNKSIQDISKNQWVIKDHTTFGKCTIQSGDKIIKMNFEHIYSQLKI